jgi:hypothetical protein
MKAIQLNRAPAIRESRAKVVQISYNRVEPNKEKSLLESNSLIATRLSGPKNTHPVSKRYSARLAYKESFASLTRDQRKLALSTSVIYLYFIF